MPRVSVIIPTYRARDSLPVALASVAAAGLPPDEVEVVLAPDDGDGYDGLPDYGLRLVRCAAHHVASGAGAARNRALARARGRLVAFLDADDTWEAGYLAALVPLAQVHGVAFGCTRVLHGGRALMHLPGREREWLEIADLGTGASFHPVMARALAGPFRSVPSQDVLHAAEALSAAGGHAPLAATHYNLHLHPRSATADRGFALRVQGAYARIQREIEMGRTGVRTEHRRAVCAAFQAKSRLNSAYMREGRARSFYEFLRDDCATGEGQWLTAGSPR
ncbi:glycosyltransferase [Roseovarius autotrophicus]|uniref:glycosyltransferase n=1 Tax=Roseovarius autotrophicus TaxID=2824121 RepID=UPI0019E4C50E|nr:glycosyltransferase [Roseovarius sp.]